MAYLIYESNIAPPWPVLYPLHVLMRRQSQACHVCHVVNGNFFVFLRI